MIREPIDASFKTVEESSEGLIVAIQKASQSCCYPVDSILNANDQESIFDGVGDFFNGTRKITEKLVELDEEKITKGYEQNFSKFVQQLKPIALNLNHCLVESSPKSLLSETTASTTRLMTVLDKVSALYPSKP